MTEYELSSKAEEDVSDIYLFSLRRFGVEQADAYLLSLEEHFLRLAENPELGRSIDYIRAGYFRSEHTSHSIFYRLKENGIQIVRVLHQRMDVLRHLDDV